MSTSVESHIKVSAQDRGELEGRERSGAGTFSVFQIIVTLGGIQIATMAFNLLRSKIVAVTGGPSGVGVISIVDQIVGLVGQVSTFSLPYASVKFLSAAHSESRAAFARQYLSFLRALLLTSIVGAAIAGMIALARPTVFGAELAPYITIVLIGLVAIPATNLTALVTNALAAAQRARASALLGLMTAIVLAAACVTGLLIAGLGGYYSGNLIASVLIVAGGMLYLVKSEGIETRLRRESLGREIRNNWRVLGFAGALLITSLTNPLGYLVARYAVLSSGGFEATGLLQAAMGLGVALRTVMRSSNALFLTPAMNRNTTNQDKLRGAVQFHRALGIMLGIIAIPMVLFPDWWIVILYSREFTTAAPYVYLFVVGESLQLMAGVNTALVIGLNRIGSFVSIAVAGDVAMMALAWLLVPRFGIAAVAVASLVNGLVVLALTSWLLWSTHRIAILPKIGWVPPCMMALVAIVGALSNQAGKENGAQIYITSAKIGIWAALTGWLVGQMKGGETSFGMRFRQLFGGAGSTQTHSDERSDTE